MYAQCEQRRCIDGLVKERRNSIANALESRLSCTNPSTYIMVAPGAMPLHDAKPTAYGWIHALLCPRGSITMDINQLEWSSKAAFISVDREDHEQKSYFIKFHGIASQIWCKNMHTFVAYNEFWCCLYYVNNYIELLLSLVFWPPPPPVIYRLTQWGGGINETVNNQMNAEIVIWNVLRLE